MTITGPGEIYGTWWGDKQFGMCNVYVLKLASSGPLICFAACQRAKILAMTHLRNNQSQLFPACLLKSFLVLPKDYGHLSCIWSNKFLKSTLNKTKIPLFMFLLIRNVC